MLHLFPLRNAESKSEAGNYLFRLRRQMASSVRIQIRRILICKRNTKSFFLFLLFSFLFLRLQLHYDRSLLFLGKKRGNGPKCNLRKETSEAIVNWITDAAFSSVSVCPFLTCSLYVCAAAARKCINLTFRLWIVSKPLRRCSKFVINVAHYERKLKILFCLLSEKAKSVTNDVSQ